MAQKSASRDEHTRQLFKQRVIRIIVGLRYHTVYDIDFFKSLSLTYANCDLNLKATLVDN